MYCTHIQKPLTISGCGVWRGEMCAAGGSSVLLPAQQLAARAMQIIACCRRLREVQLRCPADFGVASARVSCLGHAHRACYESHHGETTTLAVCNMPAESIVASQWPEFFFFCYCARTWCVQLADSGACAASGAGAAVPRAHHSQHLCHEEAAQGRDAAARAGAPVKARF